MPEYKVQWNYKTDVVGPFVAGSTVTVSVEEAEQINRDSPGVLLEVAADKPKSKPANRRQSKAETREEPITRETFKAVKDKAD